MNLGNMIKNAAGRYAGRTRGTAGRAPSAGRYNAPAGRAPGTAGGGIADGITRRIMGMLKRR
ncbi:hypothetical protein [Pseudarthrobacter sp. MM222]|uniref:hypothetical protein n=1 Tax=Pseudarthrobacter sp. MM222 TaxID=3018929 RepID=UPI0022211289|nr:hypothetical protein [Pseudarthrobacter sp. MM222]CAI3791762.1 hypothetical protein NKCBBBOE_00375 [Pseudarthrobacter sp. MM222]